MNKVQGYRDHNLFAVTPEAKKHMQRVREIWGDPCKPQEDLPLKVNAVVRLREALKPFQKGAKA